MLIYMCRISTDNVLIDSSLVEQGPDTRIDPAWLADPQKAAIMIVPAMWRDASGQLVAAGTGVPVPVLDILKEKGYDRRALAYPPITDQLDSLMKALMYLASKGTDIGPDGTALVTACQGVKTQYPKPPTLPTVKPQA
jgi:hypothetical protein